MATGIVSIAAADHGYRWITDILAVLAAGGLVVLVVLAVISWRREPLDLRDPDVVVRLFTFVAACAVLDSRLADIAGVGWTLGTIALIVWMVLVAVAVRAMASRRWSELRDQSHGAWELASVGTSGLVIVLAQLDRLRVVAMVLWVVAIAIYCLMTALILGRAFAARLDPNGFEPDGWILMGGLAIATLAADRLHSGFAVVTWIAATLWIPPLLYYGIRHLQRPQARRFDAVWWGMVFPLGMYSAATYATAVNTGWASLREVSLVFFWVAFAVWLVVAVAGLVQLTTTRSRT